MPIPTDTFWNIPRLNKIFAISAVLLLAVTGWAIIQDYDREWRKPQRDARVWDAALVEDRIQREMDEQLQAEIAEIERQIAQRQAEIDAAEVDLEQIEQTIRQLDSDRSKLEFRLNNILAEVNVMEAQLQDAITANDPRRIRDIQNRMARPQAVAAAMAEEVAAMGLQIAEQRQLLAAHTADLEALIRHRTMLLTDIDTLRNRLDTLRPTSRRARFSHWLRAQPLLQFINPAEQVHTVFLEDVRTDLGGFMTVDTADRCMTCHVNIARSEFTEERILDYLEEQVGVIRQYVLPQEPGRRAIDPQATVDAPGPVAMFEFWHHWTTALLPDAHRRNTARIRALAGQIGPERPVRVWYDGEPVEAFAYDFDATEPEAIERQNAILIEVMRAWYHFRPAAEPTQEVAVVSEGPRVRVEIMADVPERTATAQRNAALKAPEILAEALAEQLPRDLYRQLFERYRHLMVAEVNVRRRELGMDPLDPSPVLLAHPNLDLYVDIDSPHSWELVGCTSCHDGSGQETNFVLAAHTARPIWVDERTGEPVLPQQLVVDDRPPARVVPRLTDMLTAAYQETSQTTTLEAIHLDLQPQDVHPSEMLYPAPADARPTRYVDPVTGRTGRAMTQFQYWKKRYEPTAEASFKDVDHYWDLPMRPPQYIEANCVRCHTNVHDIAEHAPVLHMGRTLFTSMGCLNCHSVENVLPQEAAHLVGTDLRNVTAKLSPGFIHTWIWSPKSFRPSTKMPHFFMLENNSSDEEIRRTRQEARAITEFLVLNANPYQPKHQVPQGMSGDVDRGRTVFNTIGCVGCHTNLNETGRDWIVTDLEKRAGLAAAEAESRYEEMTYNERHAYAHRHFPHESRGTALPLYPDGTPRPIFMQHGPELSGIGTKLTAGRSEEQARAWLYDWLKDPQHYADYTLMPSLRLDPQQAVDLTEYLLAQRRTTEDPDDVWQADLAEVDSEKLRELVGFFLRARFSPQMAYQMAIEEGELTQLATDALTTAHRTEAEAESLARSLSLEQKQMAFLGKRLISHYGCMSCHAINGTEDLASPCADLSDWGQKRIEMLDFAYLDGHKSLYPTARIPMVNALSAAASHLAHSPADPGLEPVAQPVEVAWPVVEHNREDWLTHKLQNTRIYDRGRHLLEPGAERDEHGRPVYGGRPYDKLKMPTFYLTDEQITALVTFVISNREPFISSRMLTEVNDEMAQRIAFGREVAERYNCVGCHQIEDALPAVQQYFPFERIVTHSPPTLRGQGSRTQHLWLFNFLRNVEPIRPVPEIRMPSFPLTDEEITALAAYFAAASQKESQRLQRQLDPVFRYIAEQRQVHDVPDDPQQAWPGDEWHTRPEFAPTARRLAEWVVLHSPMTALQFDAGVYTPEELGRNYREALFRAQFIINLFDARYPFVESPRPVISEERFALGERFTHEMGCLQCHVMGDPHAPGAHADPTAPNLSLVYDRLQREWVRRWIQEPPQIQPGTAMPPFFSGLAEYRLEGLPYHVAQAVPNPQEIAEQYGETVEEQTQLLLDFLYAAGARRHTSVQPPGQEPAVEFVPGETAAQPVEPDQPEPQQQEQAEPEPGH